MGRTVFRLLADRFNEFLLFERRTRTQLILRDVVAPVFGRCRASQISVFGSDELERLNDAAAVVVVSNAHRPYILPEHLTNTAVVVDDAKPSGVGQETIAELRGNTLVLECLGQGPEEMDFGFDFGFAHPRYCYGCAFEAWVSAELDLQQHFVVGYPTPVQLDMLRMWFLHLGITRASFTETGGRAISQAEIDKVAERTSNREEARYALA